MMTPIEMIDVLKAYEEGKEIEIYDGRAWIKCNPPLWNFALFNYRVKQKKKKFINIFTLMVDIHQLIEQQLDFMKQLKKHNLILRHTVMPFVDLIALKQSLRNNNVLYIEAARAWSWLNQSN